MLMHVDWAHAHAHTHIRTHTHTIMIICMRASKRAACIYSMDHFRNHGPNQLRSVRSGAFAVGSRAMAIVAHIQSAEEPQEQDHGGVDEGEHPKLACRPMDSGVRLG